MALLSICTVQGRAKWSRSRITCILSVRSIINARSMSMVFTCLPSSSFIYLFLSLWWWFFFWLYASALCTSAPSGIVCAPHFIYRSLMMINESSWGGTNVIYIVSMLLLGSSIRPCCWWLYLSDWLLTDVVSHHQAASASYTVHIIV